MSQRRRVLLSIALSLACLLGIGGVTTGMLMFLEPEPQVIEQAAAVQPPPAPQPQGVGPGGPGVALSAADEDAPPPMPQVDPAPAIDTGKGVRPVRLIIPGIGVSAEIDSVGVTKTKEIEVPPLSKPNLVGWYRHGPVPGQLGPAVLLGHVNTRKGPAVFSRLRDLRRGDKFQVVRSDGTTAEFTVDGVEQIGKNRFPTERVYGNTTSAAIRLITCGGVFDPKSHHYTDNVIVYATLSATTRA